VVGADGEQLGVMDTQAALRMANQLDLDLVEVAPMARPPVTKLMDYSKFKYEQAIKAKEARRKQNLVALKEMKMRPKIDRHDYETKKGHVERFLKQGHKVSPARQDGRNMITVFSPRKSQGGRGAPPAAGRGQAPPTPAQDREAAASGRPAPVRTP
jgi:translation initiation factor IF-3